MSRWKRQQRRRARLRREAEAHFDVVLASIHERVRGRLAEDLRQMIVGEPRKMREELCKATADFLDGIVVSPEEFEIKAEGLSEGGRRLNLRVIVKNPRPSTVAPLRQIESETCR